MTKDLPIRYNISKCEDAQAQDYIASLKHASFMQVVNEKPTDDKCHFMRVNFTYQKQKVGIVYDIKGKIFSITAAQSVLDNIKPLLEQPMQTKKVPMSAQTIKSNRIKDEGKDERKSQLIAKSVPPITQVAAQKDVAKEPQKVLKEPLSNLKSKETITKTTAKPLVPKKKLGVAKAKEQQMVKAVEIVSESLKSEKIDETLPEYKNGFSVKKVTDEKFDIVLKRIRSLDGITLKVELGENGAYKAYDILDKQKQRVKLRYVPKAMSVQLQGKRSSLFGEIQVILINDSAYSAAVGSHIELTGEDKRASDIHKELKKLLPDAFLFLSEQSKIDFSFGMIDIGNQDVKLSDYSVLLVPPYRGLERFIYDLQMAQNITVKMIGQAFEKDALGNYQLKVGYRKKINSVIFNEVISALYTEYFANRNFYAHSDNSIGSQVRRIEDKAQANQIFTKLCNIINYNCKKLKEIGFATIQ